MVVMCLVVSFRVFCYVGTERLPTIVHELTQKSVCSKGCTYRLYVSGQSEFYFDV